jgi:hypothetical protein
MSLLPLTTVTHDESHIIDAHPPTHHHNGTGFQLRTSKLQISKTATKNGKMFLVSVKNATFPTFHFPCRSPGLEGGAIEVSTNFRFNTMQLAAALSCPLPWPTETLASPKNRAPASKSICSALPSPPAPNSTRRSTANVCGPRERQSVCAAAHNQHSSCQFADYCSFLKGGNRIDWVQRSQRG